MPNPLRDELSPDAKAELAAVFREMRRQFQPINVEHQRFLNKTWNGPRRKFWE